MNKLVNKRMRNSEEFIYDIMGWGAFHVFHKMQPVAHGDAKDGDKYMF